MAEGGLDSGGIVPVDYTTWSVDAILDRGCSYYIPDEFAKEWSKSILDRLLDTDNEDGVE